MWATDDPTRDWLGLGWSGVYPFWQSGSLNLGENFCGGGSINCLGLEEVYIAFSFDSDASTNAYAYGAIIDNIVLRICNAGSCTGAPIYRETSPFQGDAMLDFLRPFLAAIRQAPDRTAATRSI